MSTRLEKDVAPAPGRASASVPFGPLAASHARKVIAAASVPFQSASGVKYSRVCVSAASSRALASDTVPSACQVAPPSIVYHHVPWVASAPITAMPTAAPGEGSTTLSSPPGSDARSTSADTSVPTAPEGPGASSVSPPSAGLAAGSSAGVSSSRLRKVRVTSGSDP